MLEVMLNGSEKVPPLITDYKEYHTDTTVRFVIKMTEERLREAEAAGLHKVFKLQNLLTCNSMVNNAHHILHLAICICFSPNPAIIICPSHPHAGVV